MESKLELTLSTLNVFALLHAVASNLIPAFSAQTTSSVLGSHLYNLYRYIFICKACLHTKWGLKEAYATSYAKVVISKNKLGGRMCTPVSNSHPFRWIACDWIFTFTFGTLSRCFLSKATYIYIHSFGVHYLAQGHFNMQTRVIEPAASS